MTLRALTLDFCGTLAREAPDRAEIYAGSARKAGRATLGSEMRELRAEAHERLPLSVGGAFRYSDGWFRAFIRRIFHEQLHLPETALTGLEVELFERFCDPRTFVLDEGARQLLLGAQDSGLKVAVISNWGERLPVLLEGLGILPLVSEVLSSWEEQLEKPAPELFERALQRLEVAPEQALHLGDQWGKDIVGAQAAGMQCALIDPSGTMSVRAGVPTFPSLLEFDLYLRDEDHE